MTDAIVTGVIVGAFSTALQILVSRRHSDRVVELTHKYSDDVKQMNERIQRLEDEKILALERKDLDLELKIKESIEYGSDGRKYLHERIEKFQKEMLSKVDFVTRMDLLAEGLGEIKQTVRSAVLDASNAVRDVAKLEGKLEILKGHKS